MSVNGKHRKPLDFGGKTAIVTPWFGPDLHGGVEQQTWQLAQQLAAHGHPVDVLTTCCASFNDDWGRNTLRRRVEQHGLLTVRRFRVGGRDRRAFERVNAILMSLGPDVLHPNVSPLGEDDARVFCDNNITSPALYQYLAAEGHAYRQILFMPYLYGPTLNGLPLVAERAYLQPCLHDESYAYLTRVAEVVHAAKGLLFNSEGEYELALRLFGPGIIAKSAVVGEGVSFPEHAPRGAERVGGIVPRNESYVLYLGRQDPAKNVTSLVAAFAEFKRREPASKIRLVLAGERTVSYGDPNKGIVDLGPVGEAEKASLLRYCRALAQPSVNESFSRVIYEAWLYGRPVVVHRACLPTASAVVRSGGGYLADTSTSWFDVLHRIEHGPAAELDRLGALGRDFARQEGAWSSVITRYERAFALDGARTQAAHAPAHVRSLLGDGLGEPARAYATELASALRRRGVSVTNGSIATAPGANGDARTAPTLAHVSLATGGQAAHAAAAVYHLGLGTERAEHPGAAGAVPATAFASSPAALDRIRATAPHAQLLPVCVDPRRWDALPDPTLASALQDGKHNLVYIGPVTSIEHVNALLIAFLHYLTIEREARLTIVAAAPHDDRTFAQIFDEVRRLELADRVLVARDITEPQHHAILGAADLFVSLDDGDEFGAAFLDAMWFDVPILAYRSQIAEALVEGAGVLISDKSDLLAVAALAQMLVTDRDLRGRVVAAQRRARTRFEAGVLADRVLAALTDAKGALEVNRSG